MLTNTMCSCQRCWFTKTSVGNYILVLEKNCLSFLKMILVYKLIVNWNRFSWALLLFGYYFVIIYNYCLVYLLLSQLVWTVFVLKRKHTARWRCRKRNTWEVQERRGKDFWLKPTNTWLTGLFLFLFWFLENKSNRRKTIFL